MVFIFGAIVGSFLNVVIYRFHTGRSLGGRSHCMSCGTGLCWYELIPLISYLSQRGHCRTCSAWVPVRYVAVEFLTAVLFLLAWNIFGEIPLLFLGYLYLLSVLVVIFVYDIRHTIIPDELVLLLLAGAGYILGVEMYIGNIEVMDLALHLVAGVASALFLASFWFFSGGRWMGLGDAKLIFPLALIAGPYESVSVMVLSFWIGALVSLILLGLQRILRIPSLRALCSKVSIVKSVGYFTMKSEIPFAPFLILGFVIAHFFHVDIFALTEMFLTF